MADLQICRAHLDAPNPGVRFFLGLSQPVVTSGLAAMTPVNVANQLQPLQAVTLKASALATSSLGLSSDVYVTFR